MLPQLHHFTFLFFYLCHVISSPELIMHVGWIIKNIYIANRKNTYAICSHAEISIWCKMSSVRVNRNRVTIHLKWTAITLSDYSDAQWATNKKAFQVILYPFTGFGFLSLYYHPPSPCTHFSMLQPRKRTQQPYYFQGRVLALFSSLFLCFFFFFFLCFFFFSLFFSFSSTCQGDGQIIRRLAFIN